MVFLLTPKVLQIKQVNKFKAFKQALVGVCFVVRSQTKKKIMIKNLEFTV